MNQLFTFVFLTIFSTTLFSSNYEYYLVDEYIHLKKQEKISKDFVDTIHKKAQSINKVNEKIKIIMVYPGNQISDYWRKSKISFEKRLQELKINYELIDFFTKPAIEIKEQSKHLLKALKQNSNYLIFTLDANKHANFIERIVAKKKTKLILQNITTPLKMWENRQPFLYVGFDHVIGTKLLADYYINQTNGEGNYAVLYGPKGYVSHMRGNSFINYVSSKSNLKVLHEYYTDFNKQKAKNATLDLLSRDSNIKFIYACSTDVAFGVIEALKEKNLIGKIKVNGWGGGNRELEAIEKGLLDVTVMRMNDDNGVAMAEAIKLDILGETKKIPTVYSGDFELVKKGIRKTQLENLKKRAFRYTKDDKK